MSEHTSHDAPPPCVVGAIEVGGTKVVAAVGRTWEEIRDAEHLVVATSTPEATTRTLREWLEARHATTPLASIGIGSFGPLDFATNTIVATTPKVGWRGLNWRDALGSRLRAVPLALDTDVNAALLAEWRWGAARGTDVAAYVTVGTGIGGGLIVHGDRVHGLRHPELGHQIVRRDPRDEFVGVCPYHGDCLEGLASGSALETRWGERASDLSPNHPAWELEAGYLAQAVVNLVTIASPEVIVLGGGVLAHDGLRRRVGELARGLLGDYLDSDALRDAEGYLVAPALGNASGVVGAFALALGATNVAR